MSIFRVFSYIVIESATGQAACTASRHDMPVAMGRNSYCDVQQILSSRTMKKHKTTLSLFGVTLGRKSKIFV